MGINVFNTLIRLYHLFQGIDVGLGGSPAGDETADGVVMVSLSEMGEFDVSAQPFRLFVVDDHKLLVGGGVDEELITLFLEDGFHPHGHLDGVFGKTEVEVVCEEGIELETDEGTLGDDGAVLLLDGEEMLVGLAVGENDGLTTEGTNLRAADVEHIAMAGQIG